MNLLQSIAIASLFELFLSDMNSQSMPTQSGQLLIGEARVNILRVIAIFVLYLQHWISFFVIGDPTLTAGFHGGVNLIVVTWALVVAMVFFMLQQKRWPIWLSWFIVFCDTFLISWLVIIAGGPDKIQIILFLLLIGTSPLRLLRPLIWFTVFVSCVGYLVALGCYVFVQVGFEKYYSDVGEELRISRHDELFFLLTLIVAGVVADQIFLQTYRIARAISDREKSDLHRKNDASSKPDKGGSAPIASTDSHDSDSGDDTNDTVNAGK